MWCFISDVNVVDLSVDTIVSSYAIRIVFLLRNVPAVMQLKRKLLRRQEQLRRVEHNSYLLNGYC